MHVRNIINVFRTATITMKDFFFLLQLFLYFFPYYCRYGYSSRRRSTTVEHGYNIIIIVITVRV